MVETRPRILRYDILHIERLHHYLRAVFAGRKIFKVFRIRRYLDPGVSFTRHLHHQYHRSPTFWAPIGACITSFIFRNRVHPFWFLGVAGEYRQNTRKNWWARYVIILFFRQRLQRVFDVFIGEEIGQEISLTSPSQRGYRSTSPESHLQQPSSGFHPWWSLTVRWRNQHIRSDWQVRYLFQPQRASNCWRCILQRDYRSKDSPIIIMWYRYLLFANQHRYLFIIVIG